MGATSLIIIIATVIFSWQAFRNRSLFYRFRFHVEKVLAEKDYKRMVTSGFLHANWLHLIVNMFSLYAFGESVEMMLGLWQFLLIYFGGLIGGNLLALFLHRNHGGYKAVGASGAVCAVIFAAIAVAPGMSIGIFPFPFSIPAWIYGLIFVAYSIFGMRSGTGNISHESHLGGALTGMILAIVMIPQSLSYNTLPILAATIPTIVFIYLIMRKPHLFISKGGNVFDKKKENLTIDQRYNAEKMEMQKEVDRILEKISRRGMGSLTSKEKQILKEYSRVVK